MMAGANLLWKIHKDKHGITDTKEPNLPEYSWIKEQYDRLLYEPRPAKERKFRADIDG